MSYTELAKEFLRLNAQRVAAEPAVSGNKTEQEFVRRAREKGGKVYRAGWPDYLFAFKGKNYGVEVKCLGDEIRPSQAEMFAHLDSIGIPVYVWTPHTANRLMPWRSYDPRKHRATKRRKP